MSRPVRILVVHRTLHHAAASGRSAGSSFLNADVEVDGTGPSVRFSLAWAATRIPLSDDYGSAGIQREVEALRTARRLAGDSASIHFLSVEHDVKYAPRLAHRFGWHTSAWFHKPAERIASMLERRPGVQQLDRAWAISASQVPVLESYFGADRVSIAHHGVDVDRFVPPPPEQPRGRSVLFVGSHLRDFKQLERVYSRLAKLDPTIDLRIVVPWHTTPLVASVPAVVRQDISDDELLVEFQQAGVVFLPLIDSTANVSVLEALAAGCPLVATDVGGVAEYAGNAARLPAPGDDEAAVEAILGLLDDAAAAAHLSARARERSLEFSWPAVAAAHRWAGESDESGRATANP